MASQNLLVLLLLCVMASAVSAGNVYSAGGGSGWILGGDMNPMYIHQGDTVKFTYPSGAHNVCKVYENDYSDCNSNTPIQCYYSGNDYATLNNPGTHYFICGIANHCSDGMKVTVYVQ